jgi:hypothetical protein
MLIVIYFVVPGVAFMMKFTNLITPFYAITLESPLNDTSDSSLVNSASVKLSDSTI